jgi:TPP-dependent pyruvate/acetoin dehydrogenase alpha subunit
MVTKEFLIEFENDIAKCFNDGLIRAPIHLYSGNEDQMIEIFKAVQKDDYICCTWRNHYQCLLKGMPPEELKEKILKGKSMVMTSKEHNIVCSSIVGGIPSIATGIAWGLKMEGSPNRVWCFVGDMSMETGAFHEAYKYARGHNLPITWVVEDNGKSVETPTKEVWGFGVESKPSILYYKYENTKWPHSGAGKKIQF